MLWVSIILRNALEKANKIFPFFLFVKVAIFLYNLLYVVSAGLVLGSSVLCVVFTSLLSYENKCLLMRDGHSLSKFQSAYSITIGKLVETKKAALKRKVWFRSLNRVERGIIDLTVKYVDNIKSIKLAKVVTAIIERLTLAMETFADKLVRTIGLPLTRKISNIAVSWGNRLAFMWADDRGFARFLAFNFGGVQK